MQGELDTMKKIVESLPFHARYIIKEAEFERYASLSKGDVIAIKAF